MTKKDYKHFVKIIRWHTYAHSDGRKYIDYPDFINELCDYFFSDNSRFDERKFREALRL